MYDARNNKGSVDSNAGFAVIAILVVAAAFFLALKLPFGSNGSVQAATGAGSGMVSGTGHLEATFKSRSAKAYLTALKEVDPATYGQLETQIARAGGSRAKQMQTLIESSTDVFKANADVLVKADSRHFDAILMLTRDGLRQASRSRSKWCRGSQYTALEGMSPLAAQQFGQQIMDLAEPMQDFALQTNTLLLEAVRDARLRPVNHGELNRADKAAMQGLMMSVISDPQIMPLMMQAQTGADPKDLLAKVNVCEVGITAVLALKTLPQGTKGRLWAEAVRQARDGKGDLSQLKGLGGL